MAVSVLNVAEVVAACHSLGFANGECDYDKLAFELNEFFGRKIAAKSVQTFASNCRNALAKKLVDADAVLAKAKTLLELTGFEGDMPTMAVIPKGKAGQGSETDAEYEARIRQLAAKRKGGKVAGMGSIGFDKIA